MYVGAAETGAPDFENAVLQIVRRDPFASISEIVYELQRRHGEEAGWWKVFHLLRRHRLLRRRSRFRYAWRRG